MKDLFNWSVHWQRISDAWSLFLYRIGMAPPPWYATECIGRIDFGDTVRVDLRTCATYKGKMIYLIDVCHEMAGYHTIALFHSCDLNALLRVLTETKLAISQHQTSLILEQD